MMNADNARGTGPSCPNTDRIVDVCGALGPDPTRGLSHLRECPECGRVIAMIGQVQQAYERDPSHVDALTERVLRDIVLPERELTVRQRRASTLGHWGVVAANWVLAALAGFWGILVVSSGTVDVGLDGALVAGVLTGFTALAYDAVTKGRVSAGRTAAGS